MTKDEAAPPPSSVRIPRRWSARFINADDHNPLVLEDCPDCSGRGVICLEQDGVAELGTCPSCGGRGTTGNVVRYFADSPPDVVEVEVREDGSVVCPRCQGTFTRDDTRAWTGLRHIACGQKLRISERQPTPPE